MRKPRSQHARLLAMAAGYRDAAQGHRERLRGMGIPRCRWMPHEVKWQRILLKRAREQIEKARAIRLATNDPLMLGTLHPMDPYWFTHPPLPPGGGAAA